MTVLRRLPLRAILSVCILVLSFVAANWGYVYHEVFRTKDQAAELAFLDEDLNDLSVPRIYAAGWPSKYYVHVEYEDLPTLAQFSWKNLGINLGLGCVAIGLILLYERRLHRRAVTSADGATRRLTIVDLIVCTGLFASVIAYWRALEQVTDREMGLSREIEAAGGATVQAVYLPDPVARVLPQAMRWRMQRITEINLKEPSSELLAKIVTLPYLTRLSIGGGDYDLKRLNALSSKPLLTALRIAGRRLDSEAVGSIGALKQLQSLNLMRTNITAKGLEALGEMPRLQSLNLVHTDVTLAELGAPAWSKTVRTLRLPHPTAGQGDHLTLEGWPELANFSCNEYDERLNSEPLTLHLKQLPKLRKVSLDALQLFDLHLDGLPELSEIEPLHSQWDTRVSKAQLVPEDLWIRKLTIAASPKLRLLKLHAPAIDDMHFSQRMAMRLELSAASRANDALNVKGMQPAEIPAEKTRAWTAGWKEDVGPSELSFVELSLQDVNLAPLAKCEGLRSIRFLECGITTRQLRQLQGMAGLEELHVTGGQIDGQTIAWLAANLPALRRIGCDPFGIQQLKLENHAKLETILADPGVPVLPLDSLKLVAMPSLKEAFDLPRELSILHIDNAPSLTGLSTRGPWPENAVFQGVRDLTYFAAGGERLDDVVAEAVLACEKLEALTLAYSSVSPVTLGKIGKLKNLSYLALSGSKLDDQAISQWQSLPAIRTLRLDNTAITDQAFEFILGCENLEHLSLRNTAVTEQGLAQLAKLAKLSRIDCGGEDWSAEKMSAVCTIPALAVLDLSDSKITPQALMALRQNIPRMFRQLLLRNSQVDGRALIQLAREDSELYFDLTDTDVESEALAALGSSERVLPPSIEDEDTHRLLTQYMFAAMQERSTAQASPNATSNGKRAKGVIDPQVFAADRIQSNTDSLSQFDRPDSFAASPGTAAAPPMSIPALIGYTIGNLSKTISAFAKQGDNHAVEY